MRFVFLTMAACLAAPSVLATPQPVEALRPVEDLLAEVDAAVETREEPGFGGFLGTGHEFAQDGKPVVRAGSAAAWIAGWRVTAAAGEPDATERQLRALPGPADWPALRARGGGGRKRSRCSRRSSPATTKRPPRRRPPIRETEGLGGNAGRGAGDASRRRPAGGLRGGARSGGGRIRAPPG